MTTNDPKTVRLMGREHEVETWRFRIDSGEALNVRLPKDSELYMRPATKIGKYYGGIMAVWIAVTFAMAFVLGRFDGLWVIIIGAALFLFCVVLGRQFVIQAGAEIDTISFSPQNFEAVARRAHEGKTNRIRRVTLDELGAQ